MFEDPVNKLRIKDIESYEIYLPNFKEICYHKVNKEDVSLSLFTCKSYEEMRSKTSNKEDIKIIEELERLAMDDIFKVEYDEEAVFKKTQNTIKFSAEERGREEGLKEGLEQGKEKGKETATLEIAKNLLQIDMPMDKISKATGLPVEELKKLKED